MDPENILRNRLNSLIENGLLSYDVLIQIYGMTETVQCRNMRNRIFRKKEYSLLAQVPISVADFNALAVRNYEGTE